MKQNIRLFFLVPICLASSFLSAREPECRNMQMNIGPIVNYAHYEFGCEPNIRGVLAGLHFDYQHIQPKREFVGVRFDGRWNAGSVSNCLQEKNTIRDYRPELDLGYNFMWCQNSMRATPFTGLGFLYFAINPRCEDIKNQYFNLFVPIGLQYEHQVNDCFSWGFMAEYRIDAWTRMKVKEDCCTLCDKMKLHPRTQGLLIELPFTWFGKESKCHQFSWHLKVVPLFDWNRFGNSCREDSSSSCPSSSSCINPCSSSSSSSSCSNPCSSSSSSSSCSAVLCPFDSCESTPCDVARLNQWFVGIHVDLGIRF